MIHQRQTDRQTDGQTTSDSKTALCSVMHRAVTSAVYTTVAVNTLLPLPSGE